MTACPRGTWKWQENNEVSIWQRVYEDHVMLVGYSETMEEPAEGLKYEGFWVKSSIKKILLLFTTRIKCYSVAQYFIKVITIDMLPLLIPMACLLTPKAHMIKNHR